MIHKCLLKLKYFAEMAKERGVSQIRECAKVAQYEFFPKNSMVFEHGSIGNKFFVILEGNVSVLIPFIGTENSFFKTANHALEQVDVLGKGTCFGELAIMNKKPRSASIKALTDTHLITFTRQAFVFVSLNLISGSQCLEKTKAKR